MNEVDVHSVDPRYELRVGVEPGLRLTPVVVSAPVLNKLLQLRQLRTLRLIGNGLLVGPSRRLQPTTEISNCRLRDVYPERSDGCVCSSVGGLGARQYRDAAAQSYRERVLVESASHPVSRVTAA